MNSNFLFLWSSSGKPVVPKMTEYLTMITEVGRGPWRTSSPHFCSQQGYPEQDAQDTFSHILNIS